MREFLIDDFKGHWRSFWAPTWKVWKWTTILLGAYLAYITVFQGSAESVTDGLLMLLISIGFAGYVALFVALPVGLLALGWRLFGLGLVLAVVLAPIAFWLTFDLLDTWMLDLGNAVMAETAGSYQRHGLPTLEGSNPAARIGGAGAFAIIFLPFILIGLLMDVMVVIGDPAILLAFGKFVGALLLVLALSCLAAVLAATPVLAFALLNRTRKRLKKFRAQNAQASPVSEPTAPDGA